jgi:hypothetical protein
MKKLLILLGILILSGCGSSLRETSVKTANSLLSSNQIQFDVTTKIFKDKCLTLAQSCYESGDKECVKGRKCVKDYKLYAKVSRGVDVLVFEALQAIIVLKDQKKFDEILKKVITLGLEANNLAKAAELY